MEDANKFVKLQLLFPLVSQYAPDTGLIGHSQDKAAHSSGEGLG